MAGNSRSFFAATALSVVAVFIFSVAQVHAYAVTSTGQSPASNGLGSDYSFSSSMQNLLSPFQSFFQSLQWNTTTSISINPVSSTSVTNIVGDLPNMFTQFDNWFYGLTGVRLSEIIVVILTGLSWALGIAKEIVDWLLGFFH